MAAGVSKKVPGTVYNYGRSIFMKKIAVGLLILLLSAGILAAQEAEDADEDMDEAPVESTAKGPKTMAISMDMMPLFKGIIWSDSDADDLLVAFSPFFEFLIAPKFTIGGTMDVWFGEARNLSIFYFGLVGNGRWYALSESLDKFFLGASLGFNMLSVDGKFKAKYGGIVGLLIGLEAGYKLVFSPGFFVEPSMSFVYAKVSPTGVPTPLGWQPSLNIGWAF